MNEDLALDIVQKLRDEYENTAVIGEEIHGEVVEDCNHDSFEVYPVSIPVELEAVTGSTSSGPSQQNLATLIAALHGSERSFLLNQLDQAENVPTVSIPEITHNNLIDALKEVHNPTQLYVPGHGPSFDLQAREEINTVINSFDELERTGWLGEDQEEAQACYAIRGEYIRMKQCTRPPLNQTDWLPDREISYVNKHISEHPLYCSYGKSDEKDTEYVLTMAVILSNPTIRDNGAVKITVDNND